MITSKQRAYLRGLANSYETLFQVGKSGITDTLLKQVEDALKARELIKINSLETTPIMPKELANIIAEKTKCDVVQVVGRKMIFYKRNDKDPKIVLPKSKK
ncbi:MAG: YhbY family RNA-binding protein [Clostridia bacterium]|nr:YhbY family RNA-binding protein [Clostridia bacterium]